MHDIKVRLSTLQLRNYIKKRGIGCDADVTYGHVINIIEVLKLSCERLVSIQKYRKQLLIEAYNSTLLAIYNV